MRYRSYLKVLFQFVIFAYLFMCNTYGYSQNSGGAKTSALKAKYSLVEYHPECGGWYFLSYQKDGQMLYGFADCSGNVVASDATKYKLHKGFIELYLIDKQKKALHDQWKNDMVKWQRDYDEYNRNEAKYEAELDAYKAKRAQAHEEAKKIYNREVEAAQQRANYQNQQYAQQYQNSGKTGAILGALSGVLNSINASVSVDFDPIFNKVLADRDLLVKPAKPYNPYPTKPTEPSSGYYWEKFPLRQNARYSYVDYDKIENGSGFANVKNGNKYGLVNAEFKVIVPCTATSEVLKQQYYNGHYLIDVNGKFSVIDENATKIIKDADGIEILNGNYNVKHSGKWNIHSFSGKKINTNGYEQIKAAEGHYLCKTNNLWGVFTSNFKQL